MAEKLDIKIFIPRSRKILPERNRRYGAYLCKIGMMESNGLVKEKLFMQPNT